MVSVRCCVCGSEEARLVGEGRDFEYQTSRLVFRAVQCSECATVYLNPRPAVSEFQRIYPSEYHSLAFTSESYSFVHRVRSRLEARRLLRYCEEMPPGARVLDVGCGDGFHLGLLREYGDVTWKIEGIDLDARAVAAARARGLDAHLGDLADVDLPANSYDVVYTLQTIEHVAHPERFLTDIHRLLKPGGRLVIVTDNTESPSFRCFRRRYWGGYHFPRHWNLFSKSSLSRLSDNAGFDVSRVDTIVSPVNWVYSVHNFLTDKGAATWLIKRFTLKSTVSLALFTVADQVLTWMGRGSLLNAYLTKRSA